MRHLPVLLGILAVMGAFCSLAAITGPIPAGGLVDLVGYRAIWLFTALFMRIALALMSRSRVRAQ